VKMPSYEDNGRNAPRDSRDANFELFDRHLIPDVGLAALSNEEVLFKLFGMNPTQVLAPNRKFAQAAMLHEASCAPASSEEKNGHGLVN